MVKILLVGTGGFIGSIFRYLVGSLVHRVLSEPWFPYGTLSVNVIGCFLIGFLGGLSEARQIFNPETRLLTFIGFLGGFTTFSTFGSETFSFARDGQFLASFSNIFFHLILGIGAVLLGNILSRLLS
ncbi:fluoride efflux transporter CrcB [bacterium]|nr:fluoride efflux transporter CrcB [bacterium]